ncbi:MAG TPA: hypothetical protein VIQ01_10725 [Burkholderiales bacterium]
MNVLVIDIGGTNVKMVATGQSEARRLPSGMGMTPDQMVNGVKALTTDWQYDVVSIGYPGQVVHDCVVTEPHNLAPGWVGFDYQASIRRQIRAGISMHGHPAGRRRWFAPGRLARVYRCAAWIAGNRFDAVERHVLEETCAVRSGRDEILEAFISAAIGEWARRSCRAVESSQES